jgi:glutaconate CoA-transferase subunit B
MEKHSFIKEADGSYRPCDVMVCAMARLIQDHNIVFHGVSSHMPMIAVLLAKALHAPHAVHLNIPGGVDPIMASLQKYTSAGSELTKYAVCEFPLSEVFDLAMRGGLDVAFLSGIQFDNQGNVNASVIGDYHKPKVRLPGGAGSAVLIPTAKRAVIWRTKHDKRTFVKKVDFVTTRGNIDRIVTPLCVFRMYKDELILDSIHPTSSIEEIADQTGFDIRYIDLKYTPFPTEEEMNMLRIIDPQDYRNIEFGQK